MFDLERFRKAQDESHSGFAVALRELQNGRKTSHWIWYVFPQLAALGRSSTAIYYGLAEADEAAAYLRDPVLGERLVASAAAARAHLTAPSPVRLEDLMGSQIDALKLVSSMTLFAHVAKSLQAVGPRPEFAAMSEHADTILTCAAAQGYERCRFTEDRLRRWNLVARP